MSSASWIALLSRFEDRPKSGLMIPSCCECPQLFVPGAILPTFHLDTSNDRPACANGGVVVLTLSVWTSAQVEARIRRWFRCPPLCQRAGCQLAQLRVPAPRDSWTLPQVSDKTPASASGNGPSIPDKESLSTIAWRLEGVPELGSFGHTFQTFVGLRVWQAFAPVKFVDHWFCESFKHLGWATRDWLRGGVCNFSPTSGFVQLLKINTQNRHEMGHQSSACAQQFQRTKKLTAATLRFANNVHLTERYIMGQTQEGRLAAGEKLRSRSTSTHA